MNSTLLDADCFLSDGGDNYSRRTRGENGGGQQPYERENGGGQQPYENGGDNYSGRTREGSGCNPWAKASES
ncbi:hypothetical protein ANCCAN_12198, partial [Ancylostoma caninum]